MKGLLLLLAFATHVAAVASPPAAQVLQSCLAARDGAGYFCVSFNFEGFGQSGSPLDSHLDVRGAYLVPVWARRKATELSMAVGRLDEGA